MTGYVHPLLHINRADPNDPFCGCHEDPKALCPRWREYGISEAEHEAAERAAREAMTVLFPAPAADAAEAAPGPKRCCDNLATCETPYMHCTCRHYGQDHDGSPIETVIDGCPVHDVTRPFVPDSDEETPF